MIKAYSFDIEESPSNRAQCYICNEQINKGDERLRTSFVGYGRNTQFKFLCKRCGKIELKTRIDNHRKLLSRLRRGIPNDEQRNYNQE